MKNVHVTRIRLARKRAERYDRRAGAALIALVAIVVAAMTTLAACKKKGGPPSTPEERQAAEMQRQQDVRAWGDRMAGEISYFRDPKSDICFAYAYVSYGGYSNNATGGPALATVDCAKVEKLLVNGPMPPAPAERPQ